MRPFIPLFLSALLVAASLAPTTRAASAPATLTWEGEASRSARASLLLVLESDAEGIRLLDMRSAPVAAKTPRHGAPDSGLLFALVDREGRPLAAGSLRVPTTLHGPELDESGEVRCVSVPLERATFALRLPLPSGAWELRLFEAADHAATEGEALAAALHARPSDAGLRQIAAFPLAALAGKAP